MPPENTFPSHWNRTPFQTYLLDAFSIFVPAGEQFIVEAAEAASTGLAGGDELRGAVERFVSEEKSHQTAHRLYNRRLGDQGYEVEKFERRILADLASFQQRLSVSERLCMAGAFEHVTSVVSKAVLGSRHWLCPEDQSRQARLWRWHSAEEIAHSHVTVDLMASCRVRYGPRVGLYLLVSAVMLGDVVRHVVHFYRVDRRCARVTTAAFWHSAVMFCACACGSLAHIAVDWCRYLLPLKRHPAGRGGSERAMAGRRGTP